MSKLKPVKKPNKEGSGDDPAFKIVGYKFKCPGCNVIHTIDNDRWDFNGDYECPTLYPSVNGSGKRVNNGEWYDWRCHSWVKNGKIQFLNDSTHELAGQTVELPEIE